MKIIKGQHLHINHRRKGEFNAAALRDFDTDTEEFYPVAVAEGLVEGIVTDWEEGEKIPCRNTLCEGELIA